MDKVLMGNRIAELRGKLSQDEFAKIVKVDQSNLSKIEKGAINLTVKHLYNIGMYFGREKVLFVLFGG